MYQDDEEIYDDTSEMMAESTGLNSIRSRFEDAQKQFGSTPSTGPKPVTTPKPKVLPKYGGGAGFNICSATEKKEVDIPNALKCRSKTDNDSNRSAQKRDSKVNIPGAFLQNKDAAPPVENKPKAGIKPSKGDTNNNANINGITSSERFNKLETALAQKKPGIVGRKPSNCEASATGKVSPRDKPSDASIPIDSGSSVAPAKSKSPRGGVTGVLAQVAALSGDSNTPVDLKSRLKHVDTTKNNPKPNVPLSSKKLAFNVTSNDQKDVPWRKKLRSAKSRESTTQIQSVIRMFDGKKFHRVKVSSLGEDNAPDKPGRLDFDVDIDAVEHDYNEAVEHMDEKDQKAHGWTEVIEDIDEDGKLCPISKRAVSLIQPMTEDDELNEEQWTQAGFNELSDSTTDLPAPPTELLDEQETYDDVAVPEAVPPDEGLEEDEMYEELPEEGQPPPPVGPKPSEKPPEVPSTPLPKSLHVDKSEPESTPEQTPESNSKEQKRLEKERKKKEKEEKKLFEKKEKELKNLLKVLGVKAEVLTSTVGKGKVKSNAKGKKAGELTVSEGEPVDIIRMIDNPAGKWLVRIISTQKDAKNTPGPYNCTDLIGYCDEKNIEVDTSSILNHKDTGAEFMKGSGGPKSSVSSTPGGEEQETYEAVDGEDELIEDEIYEECN